MNYSEIRHCRICGNELLRPFLDLGMQALTGVFPRKREPVPSGPLELVKCDEHGYRGAATEERGCGLVQLRHSYEPEAMYGENYGYRSGLNRSMVEHLQRRVAHASSIAKPQPGDVILDIGSNDGTTLSAYPKNLTLIGMDPTGRKFARFYPEHVRLVPDFFGAARFERELPGKRAKIVTSIAMFYDLPAPLEFMKEIRRILADDGIWVFEQSYLPAMLAQDAYDTICHEHLSYYALRQIQWMTDRAGFKILDVEVNDVNGGSFCITVARQESRHLPNPEVVARLLGEERAAGFDGLAPFEAFRDRVFGHREKLNQALSTIRARGQTVYGYGASTKGNVVLQFCGLGAEEIPAIAEVNEDKFGSFTPGTLIPILSEAEVRAKNPDYLLVLPWHFRKGIVQRETAYLEKGGRLLFPLPRIEVVSMRSGKVVAEPA
jgi:hypothetical protein